MKNLKFIGIQLLVLLTVLAIIEIGIAFLLDNPSKIPDSWVAPIRSYYMQKDRRIIQFVPDLAHYDSSLFYRLSSGNHIFENREFRTQLHVNSFGLRDTEDAMKAPQIIFLGDSYTMGWGTEENECFPSLISKSIGLKGLNTGISSYGTVREFELFKTLDTSNLKLIVIQYDFNDFGENSDQYFKTTCYQAPSKEEYEKTVSEHGAATAYFPFKHLSHFVRVWFESKFPQAVNETPTEEVEAPYVDQWLAFITVLQRASIPSLVPILVIQVGSEHHQDVFIDPLRRNLAENDSMLSNPIHVLDIQKELKQEHYFLLDQHLNTSGHQVVANQLLEFIETALPSLTSSSD